MPEPLGSQEVLEVHFVVFFKRFWAPDGKPNGAPRLTLKLEGNLEGGVATRCDSSPGARGYKKNDYPACGAASRKALPKANVWCNDAGVVDPAAGSPKESFRL